MLGLVLDAGAILGLVYLLNDGNTPGIGTGIGAALGCSLGFLTCAWFLSPYLGLFSILPMIPITAGLLWITCDVPMHRALIAAAILLVYKLAFVFLIAALR